MAIPSVAIVGRPNVGKSALFNRIAGKKLSLVFDRPGVTRDRMIVECQWQGKPFTLIDTGGIGLDDTEGFKEAIEQEVSLALDLAETIILVVDGREGLHVLDTEIANKLRKSKERVFIAVNKIDTSKQEGFGAEFMKLGFQRVYEISASHGNGVEELMEDVSSDWDQCTLEETVDGQEEVLNIAIVGRPNVGKSSLINALLNEQRLIVSNVPGTTRDAVDIDFSYEGRKYRLVDTAGMRKKAKISDPLERVMTGRTVHSINRADICLLVMDVMEGVGVQEKKIAGLIQEANKPCVLVVNKWDLVEDLPPAQIRKRFGAEKASLFRRDYQRAVFEELFFLNYASVIFLSAKGKRHLPRLISAIDHVNTARKDVIGTGVLNRILEQAQEKHLAPAEGGKRFKMYYLTQIAGESVPTFMAFVNTPKLLPDSYRKYLEEKIRKEFPFKGCPIVWKFKAKSFTKKTGNTSRRG